jgi:predicted metalloprotease
MRWREGRRSENVEDVRGRGTGGGLGGGGFKLGIGSIVLIAAAYFLGVDPRLVMGLLQGGGDLGGSAVQTGPEQTAAPTDEAGQYAAVIMGYTEDVWGQLFQQAGQQYPPPRLRLYSGQDMSGCGPASSGMGPFYCPADQKVYVDLDFFNELTERFGGPNDASHVGSFAQAYVIAHEVGHHIQTITGVSDQVRSAQSRGSQEDGNALQVRMELQADCFAGVWANHKQDVIDPGDIESGLAAAAAVGDDAIQKRMQGYVVPESFTHGSAEQRQRWFQQGYKTGEVNACDTFNARTL